MDIILGHINADFDAFASMVAAKRLYPDAALVFPGSQEKKVRDFLEAFHPAEIRRIKDLDFDEVTRIIAVDSKSPDRLGPFEPLLSKPDMKVHVYDHHQHEAGDIHGEVEVIEPVGATATIFTEMLKSKNKKPTPMEATILALGIHEETGSLLYPSTTERDIAALAYLLKNGASQRIVSSYMKTELLKKDEIAVLNMLLDNSEELIVHGLRVKIAKASPESYMGDAAQFAHSIMEMEDIDALVVMLAMDGKVTLIGRSRAPELNIAEVLSEFGGGGHWSAASATIQEMPFEMIEERLTGALEKAVRPEMTAGDIMTRPVITTGYKSTIKEAESTMTRYGVNVLPVLDKDGRYIGLISREIVEKALFHGFAKSRITDFTTTDVFTAGPNASLREVESLMIERNQRFMPVLEGEKIVGAITRTDLLRTMYEEYLRRARIRGEEVEPKPHFERNLAASIKERYPEDVVRLLEDAGGVAGEMGCNVYMVGGSVRDLLRGEENLDIDLVVEGDAIEFAKELAGRLKAKIRTHERFGTAVLVTDKLKIDLATARTEYYEFPAALPKVESSSIKKDLQRRDFTINTLAVKLAPREFGKLVDFFGGRRDLRERTIRVLHDLSFIEDPTRAFRAVRFAVRFGFKLSKHTEELLKSSLKMDLFGRLSGARLYEELILSFKEADPIEVVKRLSDYGLLKVISPALKLDAELLGVLESLHATLLWFDLSFLEEKEDKPLLYLMALLSKLSEEGRAEALKRLDVSPKIKELVTRGTRDAAMILGKLPLKDPAPVYDLLYGHSLEELLFAMSLTASAEKKKEISHYLLEMRKIKPFITGRDLKAMGFEPGPVYSGILKAVLHERLRGRLKSKEDEENFVRAHFRPSTSCIS